MDVVTGGRDCPINSNKHTLLYYMVMGQLMIIDSLRCTGHISQKK
jgi:hypothetical protein